MEGCEKIKPTIYFIEKDFRELRRFYTNLIRSLEKIVDDINLIEHNWKIYFVIDFDQVYTFAYKYEDMLKKYGGRIDDKTRDAMLFSEFARAFLFKGLEEYELERPILIPPYAYEARNHLLFMEIKSIKHMIKIKTIKALRKKIINNKDIDIFEKAGEWISKHGDEPIPDELVTKLVDVLLREIPDLFFLVFTNETRGIETIQNLINPNLKHSMVPSNIVWPDFKENINKIIEKSPYNSKTYMLLSRIRGKWGADNIDSKAIEIIDALNKKLIPNKEIILLVSGSTAIERLFKIDPITYKIKTDKKRDITILRTPYEIFYYLFVKGSKPKATSSELKVWYEYLRRFWLTEEFFDYVRKACKKNCEEYKIYYPNKAKKGRCNINLENKCRIIRNEISNFLEDYDKFLSIVMLEHRQLCLDGYMDITNGPSTYIDRIKDWANYILDLDDNILSILESKRDEYEKQIIRNQPLQNKFLDFADKQVIHGLIKQLRKLIDLRIYYKDKNINAILQNINEVLKVNIKNKKGHELSIIYKDLLTLAKELLKISSKYEEDNNLLLGSFLFATREFEKCIQVCENTMENMSKIRRMECSYLNCLAKRELAIDKKDNEEYQIAINQSSKYLKQYSYDPRAHNNMGMVLIFGIKNNFIEKKEYRTAATQFLNGINQWERNSQLKKRRHIDFNLKMTLHNNLAWTLMKVKDRSKVDIEIALDNINIIEKEDSGYTEDPNFLDTMGLVHCVNGDSKKGKKRRNEYEEGLKLIEKAINLGYSQLIPTVSLEMMKENKKIYRSKLNKIKKEI